MGENKSKRIEEEKEIRRAIQSHRDGRANASRPGPGSHRFLLAYTHTHKQQCRLQVAFFCFRISGNL